MPLKSPTKLMSELKIKSRRRFLLTRLSIRQVSNFIKIFKSKIYRISLLEFGKFNYALIVLCGIILACVFFETMGISYALPVAECDLKIATKQQYGIINGVSFGSIALSSHLWGYLGDERGRKAIMVPTLFIAFFFTILSSFATSFWVFTILRFFNGFL